MELKKNWSNRPLRAYLFKLITLAVTCLVFALVYLASHNTFVSALVTLAVSGAIVGFLLIMPLLFEDWVNPIEIILGRLLNYTIFLVVGFVLAVLVGVTVSKYSSLSVSLISGLSTYIAAIIAGYLYSGSDIFRKGNGFMANIGSGIIQAYLMHLFLTSIYNFQ